MQMKLENDLVDYSRLSIIHNLPPFHLFHFENAHDEYDHVHEDARIYAIHELHREQIPKK